MRTLNFYLDQQTEAIAKLLVAVIQDEKGTFPTEKGRISFNNVRERYEDHGVRLVYIPGVWTRNEIDPNNPSHFILDNIISFRLVLIGDRRTRVTATLYLEDAFFPFIRLLRNIVEAYPESGGAILKYTEQLADELGKSAHTQAETSNPSAEPSQHAPTQGVGLILRKSGDFWEIGFRDSESLMLENRKGIEAIAILLGTPNKDFSAIALSQAIAKSGATTAGLSTAEMDDEGLSISNLDDGGEVMDELTKQGIASKLAELEEEKRNATQAGDYARAEKCERESEEILKYLSGGVGFGGKSRKFAGETEKARSANTKSIKVAIRKIKKKNEELGRYLEKTIETGNHFVYRPEKDEKISVLVKQ